MVCENKLKYMNEEDGDEIFHEIHENPQGGHIRNLKTYRRIKKNYY